MAALSSLVIAISAVIVLVVRAGSLEGIAQEGAPFLSMVLFQCLMVVFLLAYFAGHRLCSRTLWFDRLCVNQGDIPTKAMTLQAIPAFIAQSKQMLVVWDETFFERLWCLYEIALSAKTMSARKQHFVPTWAPIVTLGVLGMFCFGGLIVCDFKSAPLPHDTSSSLFLSFFMQNFPSILAELVCSILMSALCFQKLQQHQLMLDQLSHFEFRNAKCRLETDREMLYEQVIDLFDEALETPLDVSFGYDSQAAVSVAESMMPEDPLISPESIRSIRHLTSYPTRDQIVEEFNAYVKGPLQENILNSMAAPEEFPYQFYLVLALSNIYFGLVRVLGCDGHDCNTASSYAGYDSVSQYMLTNACIWFIFTPIFSILSMPVMLQTNHAISKVVTGSSSRMLLGSLCCTLLQFAQDVAYVGLSGSLIVVVTKFSPLWLAGFLAGVSLLCFLSFHLFLGRPQGSVARRMQLTCGLR